MDDLKGLTNNARDIRTQLYAAMTFKNDNKIKELSYRLTVINANIVDLVIDRLERIEKTHTGNVISSPIDANIKVKDYTPMNLDSIDRNRDE